MTKNEEPLPQVRQIYQALCLLGYCFIQRFKESKHEEFVKSESITNNNNVLYFKGTAETCFQHTKKERNHTIKASFWTMATIFLEYSFYQLLYWKSDNLVSFQYTTTLVGPAIILVVQTIMFYYWLTLKYIRTTPMEWEIATAWKNVRGELIKLGVAQDVQRHLSNSQEALKALENGEYDSVILEKILKEVLTPTTSKVCEELQKTKKEDRRRYTELHRALVGLDRL